MNLETPIEKLEELQVIEADVGSTLEISVSLSRDIKDFKWKKDEIEILEDERIHFDQQGLVYKLVVSHISQFDQGAYSLEYEGKTLSTFVKIIETDHDKIISTDLPIQALTIPLEEALLGATLQIKITLPTTPKYVSWKKRETYIINANRHQLSLDSKTLSIIIDEFEKSDTGLYTVVYDDNTISINIGILDKDKNVKIRKTIRRHPPKIHIVEETATLTLKHSIKLSEQIDQREGNVPIYTWIFDEHKIPSTSHDQQTFDEKKRVVNTIVNELDNISLLKITQVTPQDSGLYMCQLSSGETEDIVDYYDVYVIKPRQAPTVLERRPPFKEIDEEVKTIQVEEGSTMELTITLSKVPSVTHWIKDNYQLIPDSRVNILRTEPTTYQLIITQIKPQDAGTYILDFDGQRVRTNVVVTKKPIERPEVKTVEVDEGSRLDLSMTLPKPYDNVKWLKDEKPIYSDGHVFVETADVRPKLVIPKVKPGDRGVYSLQYDDTRADTVVFVKAAPPKPEKVEVIDVEEGSTLELTINVSHVTGPTEWRKEDTPIHQSDRVKMTRDGDTFKLVICDVVPYDQGNYTLCIGDEQKIKTRVHVIPGPEPVKPEIKQIEVDEGKRLELTVTIPHPVDQVKWKKEGSEIKPDEHVYPVKKSDLVYQLVIKKIKPQDAGLYTLEAGDHKIQTFVKVNKMPEIVEEFQTIEVEEGSTLELTVTLPERVKQFKWQKDDRDIPQDIRVHFPQRDRVYQLVISDVKREDKGIYKLAYDDQDVKTRVIVIPAPIQKPEVIRTVEHKKEEIYEKEKHIVTPKEDLELKKAPPKLLEVPEGQNVELTVEFTKPISVKDIHWAIDKQPIETLKDRDIQIRKDDDKGLQYTLVVDKSKPEDTGTYTMSTSVEDQPQLKTSTQVKITKPEKQPEKIIERIQEPTAPQKPTEVLAGKPEQVIEKKKPVEEEGRIIKEAPKREEIPADFAQGLKDITVTMGQPIKLDVTFTRPVDSVDVIWLKEGKRIVPTSPEVTLGKTMDDLTYTLNVKESRPSDAGLYSCIYKDKQTSANVTVKEVPKHEPEKGVDKKPEITPQKPIERVEEAARIPSEITEAKKPVEEEGRVIKEAPKPQEIPADFAQGLKDITVTMGQPIKLDVTFTRPVDSVDVVWLKEGKQIVPTSPEMTLEKTLDDLTYSLNVKESRPSDAGLYSCIYKDKQTSANVTVKEVPKHEPEKGVEKKLEITPQKPIERVEEGARIPTEIPEVKKPIEEVGKVIKEAPKGEEIPADFARGLQDVTVLVGEPIQLEVTFTKPVNSADVIWLKEGKHIIPKAPEMVVTKSMDDLTYKLTIQKSKPTDAGLYTCMYKDKQTSSTVTVKDIGIEKGLKDQTLYEGQPLELEVVFTSPVPFGDVVWTKDGRVIRDDERTRIESSPDGGRTYRVTIKVTKPEDTGDYRVNYKTVESKCHVTVKEIDFARGLTDQEVDEGTDVKLTVKFTAPVDDREIIWRRNSETITDIELRRDEYILEKHGDGLTYTLTIRKITKEQQGTYSVRYKKKETQGQITVKVKQDGGFEITLHDIEVPEGNDVKLYVKLRSPVDSGRIRWTFNTQRVTEENTDRTRYIFEKSGEIEYTLYIKKIFKKEQGTYAFTYDNYETKCYVKVLTPPSPPQNLDVEYRDQNILFKWNRPKDDGGSPITGYIVEIRDKSKDNWIQIATVSSDVFSILLTDLSCNKTYRLRVKAVNAIGISQPAELDRDVNVVATKKLEVPTPPRNPKASVQAENQIVMVEWDLPEWDGGSPLIGYIVESRKTTSNTWSHLVNLEGNQTQLLNHMSYAASFKSLEENEQYFFRIFAYNAIGPSLPAATATPVKISRLPTRPSPPRPPVNIREVPSGGSGNFEISWILPESDGGSPITNYVLSISYNNGLSWEQLPLVEAPISDGNPNQLIRTVLKGLDLDKEYRLRIQAQNKVGLSDSLETSPFKSQGEPLEPVLTSYIASNNAELREYFYAYELYSEDIPIPDSKQ